MKVLVYSMAEISGDGLIKLPFVAALREAFPGAHIAWCAATGETVYATWLKPVVEGLFDELIVDGVTGARPLDLFRKPFGGRTFDVVIDTQSNLRRSLVARRAAKLFISPAADFRLSDRKPEQWPEGLAERMAVLLSLAAGRPTALKPVRLGNPRALAAAEALLPPGPTYVGLAPGAGGEERRWPLERFMALAAEQHAKGRMPVFIVGPAEQHYVEPLKAQCPFALMPQVGRTDAFSDIDGPLLTIALAGRFAAAVAADAGPGHMLAAGGAPLVSLARQRRKAVKFRPAAPRVVSLVAEDFGDEAIAAIPLSAVSEALERLLSGA